MHRIWFLTGSQGLYGEDVLAQVGAQSQEIAKQLDNAADIPGEVVWRPVLTDAGAIRRALLEQAPTREFRRAAERAHSMPGSGRQLSRQ